MVKVNYDTSDYFFETDKFLEMDLEVQALYFHLLVNSDDDGVVLNPKAITRMVGADEEMLENLIKDGYIENIEG